MRQDILLQEKSERESMGRTISGKADENNYERHIVCGDGYAAHV